MPLPINLAPSTTIKASLTTTRKVDRRLTPIDADAKACRWMAGLTRSLRTVSDW